MLCTVVGFALLLGVGFPWLIGDEAFRESASAALGREFRYSKLELAYFPPAIILDSPTLGGASTFARADRAVLSVSLVPMLARIVLVDSARVEGAVLYLMRSGEGVGLMPEPEITGSSIALREPAALRFAVGSLTIPDAVLVFEDRTVSPTLRWELRDSKLQLQMDALESRLHFMIAGEIATGGRVSAEGDVTSSGEVDATVRLEAVSIVHATAYFASGAKVDGALTGTIGAVGPHVEFDLDLSEGHLTLGEITLRGPLKITGQMDQQKRPPQGQVELDATAAELRFGDFFTKPPGTRGLVRGQVTSDADGALAVDAWKFEMDDFEGRV
jgi:hypothetical protein